MTTYGTYLRLDDLLSLQCPLGPPPTATDELLFIVAHQAHELWFAVLLDTLESARDCLEAGRIAQAAANLKRVIEIQRLLTAHADVLDTLAMREFAGFRDELGTASGAQSAQYREVVILSGPKDPQLAHGDWLTPEERRRLEKRLAEPSVWDGYVAALRSHKPALESREDLHAQLTAFAEAPSDPTGLWAVAELLRAYDRSAATWRERHVQVAEALIGTRPGTGGSEGVAYLQQLVHRHYYPLLWEL